MPTDDVITIVQDEIENIGQDEALAEEDDGSNEVTVRLDALAEWLRQVERTRKGGSDV